MSAAVRSRPTIQEWFADLSAAEQVRFLVAVSHELTVVARGYYVPQSDALSNPTAVRTLNEIQHRVAAHAAAILEDPAAGRDEVAYGWLTDVPDHDQLAGWVATAVARAVKWTESRSNK